MNAMELIEMLATGRNGSDDVVRKSMSFASDKIFLRTLSRWAAQSSGENEREVYAAVRTKAGLRIIDMLKEALHAPKKLAN